MPGLEYTLEKDGNSWVVCGTGETPELNDCDGIDGQRYETDQVVGSGSKEPLKWQSIQITLSSNETIDGFKVKARFYNETEIPINDDQGNPTDENTVTRTYPGFRVVSQDLTLSERKFTTDDGDELFSADTGDVIPANDFAVAGIKDGTRYSYPLVFDKSELNYFPRLSTIDQEPCQGFMPTEPLDENADPPIYPIDALLSLYPDTRDSVDVEYTLTTIYENPNNNNQVTETVTITHTVTQPEPFDDFDKKIKEIADKSYWGNGYIHIGLYPPSNAEGFNLPVYDILGELESGVLNEPINKKQLERRSYPYDVETSTYTPYPEEDCR